MSSSPRGAELGGGPAEERGQRGGPDPTGPVRLFQRLQQDQPVVAGLGGVHAAGAGDDGRDPDVGEGVPHQCALVVGADEDRDVAGGQRLAVEASDPAASRSAMSAARSRATSFRHRPHVDLRPGPDAQLVAADHPQPQRRRRRRAGQPGLAWCAALTGRTTMSGSPEPAPPSSTCRAATSGASLRQFSASVAWVSAVRAAAR